ncbi:hypothetical protein GCM10022275_06360 [Tessaracoccus defluvii]
MDRGDHVGAGDVEDFVASLEVEEVVRQRQIADGLEHGPHGPVGNEDAAVEVFSKSVRHGPQATGVLPRARMLPGPRPSADSEHDGGLVAVAGVVPGVSGAGRVG